jgi:hypothetical protein
MDGHGSKIRRRSGAEWVTDFGQPGLVPLYGAKVREAWLGRRGCSSLPLRWCEVDGEARQTAAPLGSGSGLYDRPQRHKQSDQNQPGERRQHSYDEQRTPAREARFRVRGQA